jgi:acetyl esterase/lipase
MARCVLFLSVTILLVSGCAFKRVVRSRNITYLNADPAEHKTGQQLSIFAPRKHTVPRDVFVFVHGGNWNSGNKSTYNFLGNRLARKGIVAVIIDYPLSPKANFVEMAKDAALSVRWVKNHIADYTGNPERIFVSGHSAGGHLAALITIRHEYFDTLGVENPIKGAILIDAAGLDMYGYLMKEKVYDHQTYMQTFTSNPVRWKEASPLYYLHAAMPPMLIYMGAKTYTSIAESNKKFVAALKAFVPVPDFHILKNKKHIAMISQFLNSGNPRYGEIIRFMQAQK